MNGNKWWIHQPLYAYQSAGLGTAWLSPRSFLDIFKTRKETLSSPSFRRLSAEKKHYLILQYICFHDLNRSNGDLI